MGDTAALSTAVLGITACLGAVGLALQHLWGSVCIHGRAQSPVIPCVSLPQPGGRKNRKRPGNWPKSLPRKNEIAGHAADGVQGSCSSGGTGGCPLVHQGLISCTAGGDCQWGHGRDKGYGRCWRAWCDFPVRILVTTDCTV